MKDELYIMINTTNSSYIVEKMKHKELFQAISIGFLFLLFLNLGTLLSIGAIVYYSLVTSDFSILNDTSLHELRPPDSYLISLFVPIVITITTYVLLITKKKSHPIAFFIPYGPLVILLLSITYGVFNTMRCFVTPPEDGICGGVFELFITLLILGPFCIFLFIILRSFFHKSASNK